MGTARSAIPFDALPSGVAEAARRIAGDPAVQVLGAAAMSYAHRRAGAAATPASTTDHCLSPAPLDPRLTLPSAAVARLNELLVAHPQFLTEWLQAARGHNYRAPDTMVATLLEAAEKLPQHRAALVALAGTRGWWLAALHPRWSAWVAEPLLDDSEETWAYGENADRVHWLTRRRATHPDEARTLLADTWRTERAETRAQLLRALETGLSAADEAFLEQALDDRAREVREVAQTLLGQLPSSAFAQRMTNRAREWITLDRKKWVVAVPTTLDAEAHRDGLLPQRHNTEHVWLVAVLGATPLHVWEERCGSAEKALASAADTPRVDALVRGWVAAAARQQSSTWAAALLGNSHYPPLLPLLPQEVLLTHVRAGRADHELLTYAGEAPILTGFAHPWPHGLAEYLVKLLLRRAQNTLSLGTSYRDGPQRAVSLARRAAAHFPLDVLPQVQKAAHRTSDTPWTYLFTEIAHGLELRETMLKELT